MDLNYFIFVALLVLGLALVAIWAERYDKMHPSK